jgi:hypothetical protein
MPQQTYTTEITQRVIPVGIKKFPGEEKYWVPNITKLSKTAKGGNNRIAITLSFPEYINGFISPANASIPFSLRLNYNCFVPAFMGLAPIDTFTDELIYWPCKLSASWYKIKKREPRQQGIKTTRNTSKQKPESQKADRFSLPH